MFTKKQPSTIDQAIDELLLEMKSMSGESEEYAQMLGHLTQLTAIRAENTKKPVSKDTVALIAGNLAGILIIVSYEHTHVIASKALSFAGKLK